MTCFSAFFDGKRRKKLLCVKNMISTSERRAEHSFAGRNTQQVCMAKSALSVGVFVVSLLKYWPDIFQLLNNGQSHRFYRIKYRRNWWHLIQLSFCLSLGSTPGFIASRLVCSFGHSRQTTSRFSIILNCRPFGLIYRLSTPFQSKNHCRPLIQAWKQ